jgi:glycosyltransferase involved in cell wall biosynthesis
MKIHICYEFEEKHGGGGTSVLENLRNSFIEMDSYSEDPQNADIILFNSFHAINDIINLKLKFPEKVFVHRIDGPMGVYNSPLDLRDEYVFILNKYIADATIFQTEWSKKACQIIGLNTNNQPSKTIINAPDREIFNPVARKYISTDKFKIFYASWSYNINKGFDTLHWIDKNFNWDEYDFNFAGRTAYPFQNINELGSLSKSEIAYQLKNSHLFLFASKFDPCSNSLAEAIATGIPVLCYNGGGSPELLPKNALTYSYDHEIPEALERIKQDYESFSSLQPYYDFQVMVQAYTNFFEGALLSRGKTKDFNILHSLIMQMRVLTIKLLNKSPILSRSHGLLTGKYQKKLKIQHLNRKILNEKR